MVKTRKVPMRKCVGCNEKKEKKELVRVVRTPEGVIVLDPTGRRNGRGAYLCGRRECLQKARKNRGIERSLGVQVPDEVWNRLEEEMSAIEQK